MWNQWKQLWIKVEPIWQTIRPILSILVIILVFVETILFLRTSDPQHFYPAALFLLWLIFSEVALRKK